MKYKKNKIGIGQRNKVRIIEMRKHNKSLHEIGRSVGLTGERVRQLERVWGLPARGMIKVERVNRVCSNPKCLTVMCLKSTDKRQNCCKKCYLAKFKKTLAQKREIWRRKHYNYYHKVMVKRPDFKAYVKRCNDKYQKNKKNKKNV